MGAPPDIRFGILKCRDLVQLYFGARMVMNVIERQFAPAAANTVYPLLAPDPRRISLKIIMCSQTGTYENIYLSSLPDNVISGGLLYPVCDFLPSTDERTWLKHGDTVTLPIWYAATAITVAISTREIILTPIPVDEYP